MTTDRVVYVRCEVCEVIAPTVPPSLAWLGRHAHGTRVVRYFAAWAA